MKRQFAVAVMLIIIIFVVAACTVAGVDDVVVSPAPDVDAAQAEPINEATPTPEVVLDLIKVGIINTPPSESSYREANIKDMESVFTQERGFEAITAYVSSHGEQIDAAEGFIAEGVEILLISAVEPSGWDLVLQSAADAGIRVFLYDRMIQTDLFEAAVVPDIYNQGMLAVRVLEDLLLDEYNILHIQGEIGSDAQIGRTEPFMAKVNSNPDWTIIHQQSGDWIEDTAKKIVSDVIEAGDSFNIIYAESDEMAAGAVAALQDAGITHGFNDDGTVRDVVIVSVEANRWALRELLAGNWNFIISNSPFQAEIINEIIQGERTVNPGEIIISPERAFDARTITEEEIEEYGIGQ